MYLIVGIDPGKTVGISCVSLDGRLVSSAHKSGVGPIWAAEMIQRSGTPALIATDKHREGSFVRKLGAVFNVSVFYPDSDLDLRQKRKTAKGAMIKDPHERDAFASAMKAFNEYKSKLGQVEGIAKREKSGDADRVKAMVIKKFSIDEALHNRPANRK